MKNIVKTMRNTASNITTGVAVKTLQIRRKLAETKGEGYIDTGATRS